MIGDGYCDDRFNLPLEGCGFDGGDCCGPKVNTLFCEHCLCLDENTVSEDECRHLKVIDEYIYQLSMQGDIFEKKS